MSRSGVRRRDVVRDPPAGVVEYGSLSLLLIAYTLLELFVGGVARAIGDLSPFYVSPRFFWTVVYTVIGMTVLAAGYGGYHRIRAVEPGLDAFERVRLALALCLLLLGGTYVALGVVNVHGYGTRLLGSFLVSVVATGLLVAVYLRARRVEIGLSLPGRPAIPVVGIAVAGPVLVVLALWFVTRTGNGSLQWPFDGRYARPVSLAYLVRNTLIPSLFVAFGTGLLFHGAIQGSLRVFASPADAVVGTTVLAGCYAWTITWMLAPSDGVAILLAVVAAVALVVLVTALVVRLHRQLDLVAGTDEPGVATAATFGTATVALLVGAVHYVLGSPVVPAVGYALGFSAIVGIAAVAYERTRSIWVPVLALATFYVAVDLAAYIQFLGGTIAS